jgi:hypothetical protein
MTRSRIALLLTLLLAPATPARGQSPAPDYHDYQALLNQYVTRLGGKGAPADTRFDYEQLYVDEKIWSRHFSDRLSRIHGELLSVKPADLAPADRTAWALNTYNFLVIERATLNLLVPQHRFQRYKTPDDMSTPEGPFFTPTFIPLEGRTLSLDQFERRYVFDDTTAVLQMRTRPADPRRCLAVCAGKLGWPPLPPRAFRGDSLEAQLDQAARTTLALPRFVTYAPRNGTLRLSDYLARHRVDFGGTVPGIIAFVERYGPNEVRKGIRKFAITEVGLFMQIDATLNQKERPKQAAPTAGPGQAPGL